MTEPTLEQLVAAFCDVVDRAIAHREFVRGGSRGMHVPYHDDFAHVAPSTEQQLRRWRDRFREVMAELQGDNDGT